jgi:hypothetical protein
LADLITGEEQLTFLHGRLGLLGAQAPDMGAGGIQQCCRLRYARGNICHATREPRAKIGQTLLLPFYLVNQRLYLRLHARRRHFHQALQFTR